MIIDMKNLGVLLSASENVFNMESELRKQRHELCTAILRECGGTLNLKGDNVFMFFRGGNKTLVEVKRIILVRSEDYEIYIENGETGKIYDYESDIELIFNLQGYDTSCELLDFLYAYFSKNK